MTNKERTSIANEIKSKNYDAFKNEIIEAFDYCYQDRKLRIDLAIIELCQQFHRSERTIKKIIRPYLKQYKNTLRTEA